MDSKSILQLTENQWKYFYEIVCKFNIWLYICMVINDRTMKEYFLKVNNDGSLNGAYLSVWENGNETILIQSIKEATAKGWKSTKKIFEKLDILQKESDNDIIITENCANRLISKYGNVETKAYGSHIPVSPAHVIANFITKNGTDPYDRG